MNETLDPTIKNLASAIKRQESGGAKDPYNSKGASGEHGAYQFMPDTWKGWAKTHLGDEKAPMTMENQNKVAYNQIKLWKDKGYNPAQIAAAWNAGEGSLKNDAWKTKVGVNQFGVKYDTPSYVKNVSKYYQDLKGQTPSIVPGETQPTLTKEGIDISGLPTLQKPEYSVVAPVVDSLTKPFTTIGGGVLNLATQAVGGQPRATYSNPLGTQQDALGYRGGEELNAWDTAKQGVGAVAEGASYAMGGPALKGAVSFGKAGVMPYVKETAKATGRMLGTASAGASLQEGDSVPRAAAEGVLGYGAGYLLGGLTGLAAAKLNKTAGYSPEIFDNLDNAVKTGDTAKVAEITSSPQYKTFIAANKFDQKAVDNGVTKVRTAIEDGIDKSYGVAKLTRSEKAEALTDDGIKAMVEHMQNTKNPIADTKLAIENKANDLMDEALNPIIDKVRAEKLPLVPLDRKSLLDDFNTRLDKTYLTDKDKEGIRSYVEDLITKQSQGSDFGIVDAGIIRRNANFDFVNPKNKGAVARLLGNTMRDALGKAEQTATDPATKAIIAHINAVNKEYSRLMQGIDVVDLMARFPGQKGSELLNKAAGFMGAGATGNNPLAYLAAHRVTNNLQNVAIRSKNNALFGDLSGKAGPVTSSELIGNAQRILNNVTGVAKKEAASGRFQRTASSIDVLRKAGILETTGRDTATKARQEAVQQNIQNIKNKPLGLPKPTSNIQSANNVPIVVNPTSVQDVSRGFTGSNPLQTNLRGMADPSILNKLAGVTAAGVAGKAVYDKADAKYGKETYQREPEVVTPTETPKVEELVSQIANAETRGEKEPYKTAKWSDRTLGPASPLGKDLGKYQITSARLREKSKEFLGRVVKDAEFLASKELQDAFIKAQVAWQLKHGLTPEQVLATHRRGWGNMKPEQLEKAVARSKDYIAMAKSGK